MIFKILKHNFREKGGTFRNFICYDSYSELSFESFADCIQTFNNAHNIKISDKDLKKIQRLALRIVIDEVTLPLNDYYIDDEKLLEFKTKVRALDEKN